MKAFLLTLTLAAMALPALGEVTLYGREGFEGRSVTTREPLRNLEREGFANRASSAVVRGGPYEFCDGRGFEGRCVVLGPGRYPTLAAMGMNDAIVSLRPAAAAPPPAAAQITLFGREGFEGRSFATQEPLRHLERQDFNDRASSAIVEGGPFEICDGRGFEGRCLVLRPGRYPTLAAMGMNDAITSVRPVALAPPVVAPPPVVVPPPAVAQITLFGREGFEGRSFATHDPVRNLERHDFGDRASSAIVQGGRFEICDGLGFEGRCMVLRPGQYPSLAAMGMNDAITSLRPVERHAQYEERRFAPPPPVAYDYRRRADERLFDAEVVAVRAVYGQSEQRCWVEREYVQGGDAILGPRAVAGAIIGGILGHQVGSGRGNDAATAAGAVAGAAIGSNYGGTTYSRDVQRCSRSQVSGSPQYWDVTYRFRGVDRYVQMTRPPGATITVNRDGEPRAG